MTATVMVQQDNMPTFLIVGAMKAGTTALYDYLKEHPDVYMSPVKEPNFFSFIETPPSFRSPIDAEGINAQSVTSLARYQALFETGGDMTARGEASHWYLYWPTSAAAIKNHIPGAKIIIVLRDPVERAYSEYLHFVRDGVEPCETFWEALQDEPRRLREGWAMGRLVDRGRYYQQVKRYVDLFDEGQIHILIFEEFKLDPLGATKKIYEFIGVDSTYVPSIEIQPNRSGIPRNRLLHYLINKPRLLKRRIKPLVPSGVRSAITKLKNRNLVKPEMDERCRRYIRDLLEDDMQRLEALLDRDLTDWR